MGLEDVVLYGIVVIAIVLLIFCFFGATNLCNPFTQLTQCTWLANCLDCARCCGISRNPSSVQKAKVVDANKKKKEKEEENKDAGQESVNRRDLVDLAILEQLRLANKLANERKRQNSRSSNSEEQRLLNQARAEEGRAGKQPDSDSVPAPVPASVPQASRRSSI